MIARVLHMEFGSFPASRLCALLGVSRSSFYRPPSPAPVLDEPLVKAIEAITLRFPGYGYRRVVAQLRKDGLSVGTKLVRRVMQERSLLCQLRRRWVKTTDSEHGLRRHPNLAKHFQPSGLNQLWVSDITYIRLERGFCYLAAILDAHSRKVVGWHLSMSIDAKLVLVALRKALETRNPEPGWIHHSDQGVQYACRGYVEVVEAAGGKLSMSSKACPYDNAKAESFFATLKKEEVHLGEYRTFADAHEAMSRYIDCIYNQQRLHSKLGYITPEEFEQRQQGEQNHT